MIMSVDTFNHLFNNQLFYSIASFKLSDIKTKFFNRLIFFVFIFQILPDLYFFSFVYLLFILK